MSNLVDIPEDVTHETYHQITIDTLKSMDGFLGTLVLYSNLLLTLLTAIAVITVVWLYRNRE